MAYVSKALLDLNLALRYSLAGLRAAWRHERAFRQEVAVLIVAVPIAFWFGSSGIERALLIGSWLFVIIVELVNSAIESAVNRIGPERHELAGRAKDLGSASVFCGITLAVVVWLLVLLR
jgi:diacylglycerol kinase (ATP)